MNGFPRRQCRNQMTPAELAIANAMEEVEMVGANPHLTDAIIALEKARDSVADYVDGVPHPSADQDV